MSPLSADGSSHEVPLTNGGPPTRVRSASELYRRYLVQCADSLVWAETAALARSVIGWGAASVLIADRRAEHGRALTVIGQVGLVGRDTSRVLHPAQDRRSIAGVAEEGRPIYVDDVLAHPDFIDRHDTTMRSMICWPLRDNSGDALGVLCVHDAEVRPIPADMSLARLSALAHAVTNLMESRLRGV